MGDPMGDTAREATPEPDDATVDGRAEASERVMQNAAKKTPLDSLPALPVGHIKNPSDITFEISNDTENLSTEISVASPDSPAPKAAAESTKQQFQPAVPGSEDTVRSLRTRKNSAVANNPTPTQPTPTGRFRSHQLPACEHAFDLTDASGVCSVCRKRVNGVRTLGYRCRNCGILVHQQCKEKLLGVTSTKNRKKPRQLVFLEHMRLGIVELIISTRGIPPINISSLDIVLQHRIFSNSLTTWSKLIKQLRRTYTTEILKSAPSFMLRGWGFSGRGNKKDKREQETEATSEPSDALTDKMKVVLLLGDECSTWTCLLKRGTIWSG